jgi:preprotein translocase subunit SecG
MIDTILQIVYVVVAVAMVVLILLQRGAGAQAGSGFGAGASGTVFGSRGSANFLTTATKWLAFTFFGLSLFMAWKAVNINAPVASSTDIGVMSNLPSVPESQAPNAELPLVTPDATIPAVPESIAPEAVAPVAVEQVPASEPAATDEKK